MSAAAQRISTAVQRGEHPGLSFGLAVAVHALIGLMLYVGVQWRTEPVTPMSVELWSEAPPPPPAAEPQVETPPAPQPPEPEVEPEPAPEPAPVKPDIEIEKPKPVKKPEPKPEPKKPEPKKPEPKPEPKKPEAKPNKVLAELANKFERPPVDASVSLAALAARQQAAEASARAGAMDAYYGKVRNLIRRNMSYPDDGRGNPEAEFEVTLLPDMTVMGAELKKSSGVVAFDDAVKRAILRAGQYPALTAGADFGKLRKHTLKYRLRDE
ncbi:energy transducer TonB [Chitinimonas sp. BJYL2]|uniref:energy transducer TonB n=1 Tax=Chitinimonas sp. BJYL2 TaxID=2976696 RepID=UPI0022B3A67F|nr:energy transducer TonB [Chitinimonas sp. BJYL2]